MKHLLLICTLCAACLSLSTPPDGGPECDCVFPRGSDAAMNKAYDETSLGNGGFKLTESTQACDELDRQRRLIGNSLRRASLENTSCHRLLLAQRDGYTVVINYFLLGREDVEKVCNDLSRRKKKMLAGKEPVKFDMLCMNDYLVVATSEGRDDSGLKAVMYLLGLDGE